MGLGEEIEMVQKNPHIIIVFEGCYNSQATL